MEQVLLYAPQCSELARSYPQSHLGNSPFIVELSQEMRSSSKAMTLFLIMWQSWTELGTHPGEEVACLLGPYMLPAHKPLTGDMPLIKSKLKWTAPAPVPLTLCLSCHSGISHSACDLCSSWVGNESELPMCSTWHITWHRVRAHRTLTERIMRCKDCPAFGNGQQWEAGTGWAHTHHSSFPPISPTLPGSKINQKQVNRSLQSEK